MISDILLLGDEKLYGKSEPITFQDDLLIQEMVEKLHETLLDYRRIYGAGRAIAAPQIGYAKRLIYMNIDGEAKVLINPILSFPDSEKMMVLDDCMSFPTLYVKVMRYKRCIVHYQNENGDSCSLTLEGDLAELIQHEYDHLDGILATMRAESVRDFVIKPQVKG